MARNNVDHPVLNPITQRWSPYVFSDKPVSKEDLLSLFEAARWAASSFNEQPWRYIVATKDDPQQFQRVHSCLVEGNRPWTQSVPVLALGVISRTFAHNGKPNRVAEHDLGAASAQLTLEATARGLLVHQMAGILPDVARTTFNIPEGFDAWTGLAIGYHGDPKTAPQDMAQRDARDRVRRSLSETFFDGTWGDPSPIVRKSG